MRLDFEMPVHCEGARMGEIADVIVDPSTRSVTHVVVAGGDDVARLVPFALVGETPSGRELVLGCTIAEVRALDPVRETAYLRFDELPEPDTETDVGVEDMVSMPSYDAAEMGGYAGELSSSITVAYDRIPKGEAELRRSSDVVSSDGHRLGSIEGVVTDGTTLTYIVLERGHLWGTRDVTIPAASVEEITTDSVRLRLAKDEVGALPSTHVGRRRFF